jgi:hypothetical protein
LRRRSVRAKQRGEERKEGRGGGLTGGAGVSAGEEKRERDGGEVGCYGKGEVVCWATRLKGKEVSSFFSFFSFPNLFKFKSKFFKPFHKIL